MTGKRDKILYQGKWFTVEDWKRMNFFNFSDSVIESNDYNFMDFLSSVDLEYHKARTKFPKMSSAHEGYAIIKEELDELWDLIKQNKGKSKEASEEVKQVAAMCLAYYLEVILGELYNSSKQTIIGETDE